ncbi:hypothetical protein ABEF95_003151 [Exophiala dermatitidis]
MSYPYGSGVGGGMPNKASATTPVSNTAQERLLHTEQSYARKQHELAALMQTRAGMPITVAEGHRNTSEIAHLRQTLLQMEAEISQLKATNFQQMATIRTQSEALSNPRQHYVTPVHFGGNPAMVGQYPQQQSYVAQQTTPDSRGQQGQQIPMGYQTTPTGGGHSGEPRRQEQSSVSPATKATTSDAPEYAEVQRQFAKVWSMAEAFAVAHVNVPSTAKDNAMPQRLKDVLLNAATRNTAYQFMSTPMTRYFLVTKVILQWIMRFVLKADCFSGFDKNIDSTIESCRSQIYQSTPAQVKHQLLTTVGLQMAALRRNPRFEGFLAHLAKTRGNKLWEDITPMMHQKTARDWEDMLTLMREAHKLAFYMFSGPDEYRFEFPQHGQPFNKNTMESKDPQAPKSPDQLEAKSATVRLAYTPQVMGRRNFADGHVATRTMLRAYVLVKPGR